MEWIFVGLAFVALAAVVWCFYTLWTSAQELAKGEPEELDEVESFALSQQMALALAPQTEPHCLFPERKADGSTTLSWTHRLRQDDRCEVRFPGMPGGFSIVGAVDCGYYTLLLLADGVSTARVVGPMPVEIVRS